MIPVTLSKEMEEFIKWANKNLWDSGEEFQYLNVDKLAELLNGAPRRIIEHPAVGKNKPWKSHEVFINEKWKTLGRTDLRDDVRTYGGISIWPVSSDTCHVSTETRYGARLTDDGLYIIDSFSDG